MLLREAVMGGIREALNQINVRADKVETSIASLRVDLETRDSAVKALQDEKVELRKKLNEISTKADRMEQENNRNNLIFTCVPIQGMEVNMNMSTFTANPLAMKTTKGLTTAVLDIIRNTLQVPIEERDISDVFYTATNNRPPSGRAVVLVRFTRRSLRDRIYRSRSVMRGVDIDFHHVFLNEDLSAGNKMIYGVLRQKVRDKKIVSVWTSKCRLNVKTISGRIKVVRSLAEANTVESWD